MSKENDRYVRFTLKGPYAQVLEDIFKKYPTTYHCKTFQQNTLIALENFLKEKYKDELTKYIIEQ